MGYIKGKPLSVRYSLRLPLSSIKEGFHRHCRLGMYDQYKVEIIYQLLQDGVLLYHPPEDFFRLYKMIGCTHYFTFSYLEDNPVGYVDMAAFCSGVAFFSMMSDTTTLQ